MNFEEFDDIVDAPYSQERPTTEETKKSVQQFQHRLRGSVRIATGQLMEDDVFKQLRNEAMKKPLP